MQVREHPLRSARARRQILELPATFIAARLGVTVTTYNRFERGERRAYLDQAHVIAKCLGCSVDDLARPIETSEEIDLVRNREQMRANITSDVPREEQIAREHQVADQVQHDLADHGFVTEVTEDHTPGTVVVANAPDQPNQDAAMLADWDFGDDDSE